MTEEIYKLPGAKSFDKSFLVGIKKMRKQNFTLTKVHNTKEIFLLKNSANPLTFKVGPGIRVNIFIISDSNSTADVNLNVGRFSQVSMCQLIIDPKRFAGRLAINLLADSRVDLSNLILASGTSEIVLQQNINHLAQRTRARITTRRVQLGSAHSVVYGLLNITKKATNTDSYLTDRSLLLGEKATAVSVPSLEILTDSVKASHSATCSQLPTDQLFYLRSRGLKEAQARELLLKSFCLEILPRGNKFDSIVNQELTKLLNAKS